MIINSRDKIDFEENQKTKEIGNNVKLESDEDPSKKTEICFPAEETKINEKEIKGSFSDEIEEDEEDEEDVEENQDRSKLNDNIKNGKWTDEEDDQLKRLVTQLGAKNWKKVAVGMPTRTAVQCLHRWTKILQPGLVKGPWTIEEDRRLMEWVQKKGPHKWSHCAENIPGRSGKQCRERWFNTLNPAVKKGNWTAEEDFRIFDLFSSHGSKWSKIASHFGGRTENSIKNRFYSTLRRIYAEKRKLDRNFPYASNAVQDKNSTSLDELLVNFPEALEEKRDAYLVSTGKKCNSHSFLKRKIARSEEENSEEDRDEHSDCNSDQNKFKEFTPIVKTFINVEKTPNNYNIIPTDGIFSIKKSNNSTFTTPHQEFTNESTSFSPSIPQLDNIPAANNIKNQYNLKVHNNSESNIKTENIYSNKLFNNNVNNNLPVVANGQSFPNLAQNLQLVDLLNQLTRINYNLMNTKNEFQKFYCVKNNFFTLNNEFNNNMNNFLKFNLQNFLPK